MTIEEILLEVEKEFQVGGLSDGVYADYAREVAKRFAAALESKNDELQKDAERWRYMRRTLHREPIDDEIDAAIAAEVIDG